MDNTTQGELIRGERLRAVGELTNDVAHDFNNLLAAILGRVELLLMRHDLAVDVRQELQLIQQATLDGAETVRRLWEPSRPRADRPIARIPGIRHGRLLVVDDNDVVRQSLSQILRMSGHEVTPAADGAEALHLMSLLPFDIVLTDLNLGLVQGWDVAAHIRRHWPGTVVGLMTGGATQVDRDAIERHQIDFILAKPFRRADFLATIANGMAIAARRRLSTTIRS